MKTFVIGNVKFVIAETDEERAELERLAEIGKLDPGQEHEREQRAVERQKKNDG